MMIKNKIISLNDTDNFEVELDEDQLIKLTFIDYDQFVVDKIIEDNLENIDQTVSENELYNLLYHIVVKCKYNGIINNFTILTKIYNYLRIKLPNDTHSIIIKIIIKLQMILDLIFNS